MYVVALQKVKELEASGVWYTYLIWNI
jgi:hypothetical protein